jgi:hypothetical protein
MPMSMLFVQLLRDRRNSVETKLVLFFSFFLNVEEKELLD